MAVDNSHSQDVDLDRTDRLPVLQGIEIADDVEDDAVRMDAVPAPSAVNAEFSRSGVVDLPSLAQSVRSVEERIARQNAEFEALSRAYQKALEAETAANERAQASSAEVATLRASLEAATVRGRDADRLLLEKEALLQAAHARLLDAAREAEQYQGEVRTLRETLSARDSSLAQVNHSLSERDAQLSALQREHARVVPAFEERSRIGAQLEADLAAERERAENLGAAMREAQQSAAAAGAKLTAGEYELDALRRELAVTQAQASAYLETLRTREWRQGFDLNLFRELDAKVGAAQGHRGALQLERDRLREQVGEVQAALASRDATIGELERAATEALASRARQEAALRRAEEERAALAAQIAALQTERGTLTATLAAREAAMAALQTSAAEREAARAKSEVLLQQVERACADLSERIALLEKDRTTLREELGRREAAVAAAQGATLSEAQRGRELLAAAQREIAELAAQITHGQTEVRRREEDIAVLTAQLTEARRPLEPIQAEVGRLNEELTARAASLEEAKEENRALRATLERTRGALEEREFLIRRLERSETNNASALGRIQTSIERLGAPGPAVGNAAAALDFTAELVRLDGQHHTTHVLARRTRIGRAPGCEMQIESSSVSRHHALVLLGPREVVIEDLNSTNGVLVNGRKVSRHVLNDGDLLAIGEAQFRLSVKLAPRRADSPAAAP